MRIGANCMRADLGSRGLRAPSGFIRRGCGREDSSPKTEARSAEGRAPEDALTRQPSASEGWCSAQSSACFGSSMRGIGLITPDADLARILAGLRDIVG